MHNIFYACIPGILYVPDLSQSNKVHKKDFVLIKIILQSQEP